MGLFKLKKNKRYSYSGRFSEETTYVGKHSAPKKIKSKFDEFRSTVGDDNSFRTVSYTHLTLPTNTVV